MLLNVYICHFAFWYEMIDSLCSSYSSSLAFSMGLLSEEFVPELGHRCIFWPSALIHLVKDIGDRTSHMWVVHKKWRIYNKHEWQNTIGFYHRIWCFHVRFQKAAKNADPRLCIASQMGYKVKSFQLLGWFEIMGGGSRTYVPVEDVLFQANIIKSKRTDWTISVESLKSNRSVRVLVVVIHEGYPQSNFIEVDYFASKIGFVIGFTFAVYLVCWYLNQAFWHVLGF